MSKRVLVIGVCVLIIAGFMILDNQLELKVGKQVYDYSHPDLFQVEFVEESLFKWRMGFNAEEYAFSDDWLYFKNVKNGEILRVNHDREFELILG